MRAKQQEPFPEQHGWEEQREFHPLDILIRKHGFRIFCRKGKEPIWTDKTGERFTQSRVIARLPREEVNKIRKALRKCEDTV